MQVAADMPDAWPFWFDTYHREDDAEGLLVDLRSVVIHELGHVLGLQHADAVAYNTNPDTGQPYNRNFQFTNDGVPFKTLTYGGELMNEGYSDTPGQKGQKGLATGEYHRVPSIDELDVFNYMDLDIEFVEVGPDDPADIVIGVWNNPQSSALGAGCPSSYDLIDDDDVADGWSIVDGGFDVNAGAPVGMNTEKRWYEFHNTTGESVFEIQLGVEGTSTSVPVSWSSTGGNRFTNLFRQTAGFDQEWGLYSFDQPNGGSVIANNTVEFTLELDVHDWRVDYASARTDENWVSIPLADIETTQPFGLQAPTKPPGNALPLGLLPSAPTAPGPEDVLSVKPNLMPSGGFVVRPAGLEPPVLERVELFHLPTDLVHNQVSMDMVDFDRLAAADPRSFVDLGVKPRKLQPGSDLMYLFGSKATAPELERLPGRTTVRIPEQTFKPREAFAIRVTLSNAVGTTRVISVAGEIPGGDNLDVLCSTHGTVEACCVDTSSATVLTPKPDSGDVSRNVCTIAGAGDDQLRARPNHGQTTRVALGDGNDRFDVDAGIARAFGGRGTDTIVAHSGGRLLASGGEGDDHLEGANLADELVGGAGADLIVGNAGPDRIWGDDGNDTIFGDDGDDDIQVGSGRDFVDAGAGNDRVELSACAIAEADVLDGGDGEDTLVIPGSFRELLASGADVRGFERVIEYAGAGIDDCG